MCVCVCVCVYVWLSGWLREKKFAQAGVCYSKRVMGLPEWNVSHGHTHRITVDVVDIVIVSQ